MHLQPQLQSVQAEQHTSEQYASDRMGLRRAGFYHRRACCLPGRKSPHCLYGKTDKNSFMQNLLLDRYSQVEAFNKAARLHITPSARRAVFLVETKQHKDENALATIRNIFSAVHGILSLHWMIPASS